MRDIELKANIFWVSADVYDDHTEQKSTSEGWDVTFCGFDTLRGDGLKTVHAKDQQSYVTLRKEATQNVADGMHLDQRVKKVLQELELDGVDGDKVELTAEKFKAIGESGLAVELLFLPYPGLREYILATSASST